MHFFVIYQLALYNAGDGGSKAMRVQVILESSDDGGFTAIVPGLPGCISEGDSKEEALSNIREAIELYMEPVDDDLPLNAETEVMELTV